MLAALHFSPARVALCCDWQINYGVHACVPCRRLSRGGGNLPSCKAMRLALGGHSTPANVYLPDLVTGTGLLRRLRSPGLCAALKESVSGRPEISAGIRRARMSGGLTVTSPDLLQAVISRTMRSAGSARSGAIIDTS
ncbi:hypothetical protein QQF64_003838 [Cirrhinus molitorella]|uniref:Uncharacterized protein n=1 Tax=Cirrhinus molitorella TaxID=172907 RepID=A0ABR3MMG3_9TELE